MTLDEFNMNRRKIEKDTATAEIGLALNRLMEERRNPDLRWTPIVGQPERSPKV